MEDDIIGRIELEEGVKISVYDEDGERMDVDEEDRQLYIQAEDKVLIKVKDGKMNIVVLEGPFIEYD